MWRSAPAVQISGSLRASEALLEPEQAVAVAALLWHEHGPHMPFAAWDSWAAAVEAAAAALPCTQERGRRSRVWVLRFLSQVAAQVPVVQSKEADRQWERTWQARS